MSSDIPEPDILSSLMLDSEQLMSCIVVDTSEMTSSPWPFNGNTTKLSQLDMLKLLSLLKF
jgi:hypothetical protein